MKGQGKYIVGVYVMVAAISLSLLGMFATKFVISQALINMNENFARYESLTHTYMITNNDINNMGNHSELDDDLGSSPCGFNTDVVIDEGDRYEVAIMEIDGGSFGSCTYNYYHNFDEPDFKSSHLTSSSYSGLFPYLPYWSKDGGSSGKSFYIQTLVEPERDY